jgi:hypothetical protein
MDSNVIKLDLAHSTETSIPSVIANMEKAEATIVIHIVNGKWILQHIKGETNIWKMIGIFQSLVTHFCNVANGVSALVQTKTT